MATDSEQNATRIWCGPDDPPWGESSRYSRRLNSIPPNPNVFVKAENITSKLVQQLPDIALDLLEVASYVYCADQSKTRGGKTLPHNGASWYRHLELSLPVRCVDLWCRPEISGKLTELLQFLADDSYEFHFRWLEHDLPRSTYFEFDEGQPWFKPDSVLLFSGGLDSLAGAVEELQDPTRRILLVSHRPVTKIDAPQKYLVSALRERYAADNRLLHVPVWINKEEGITRDATQRSRSFLYASIAAVIARMVGTQEIKFYENGIVSCNLPISNQVTGARASRSTHPKSLKLMAELFSLVFDTDFKVENPFINKTKSDVVGQLRARGATDLIPASRSCAHIRTSTKAHTHCGVCSQCIERRLATLFHGLESDDPEESYETRLFLDPPKNPDDVVMLESYIQHARKLELLGIEDFYQSFPDGFQLARAVGGAASEAGQMVYDLHRRHGEQAGIAIRRQIEQHAELIRTRQVPSGSLLDMIVGGNFKSAKARTSAGPYPVPVHFPTPEKANWEDVWMTLVSHDSVLIKVGDVRKRFTGFDMGFRDGRRGDRLNKQWDLLENLAQSGGILDWRAVGLKEPTHKRVEELNKTLCRFFCLSENPLSSYKKKTGWKARFHIVDKAGGKQ